MSPRSRHFPFCRWYHELLGQARSMAIRSAMPSITRSQIGLLRGDGQELPRSLSLIRQTTKPFAAPTTSASICQPCTATHRRSLSDGGQRTPISALPWFAPLYISPTLLKTATATPSMPRKRRVQGVSPTEAALRAPDERASHAGGESGCGPGDLWRRHDIAPEKSASSCTAVLHAASLRVSSTNLGSAYIREAR